MIFLLSASGMFLSNELSSVLQKVSHREKDTPYPLSECIINYFMWSTSRGSPLRESVGGLTHFRSHLSKFLSAVGSIFQIFVLLRYNFLSLCPFYTKILLFACFRSIKIIHLL